MCAKKKKNPEMLYATRIPGSICLHKGKIYATLKKNNYDCLVNVCSYMLLWMSVWEQGRLERQEKV